jgi:hypothetical protein
MTDELTDKMKEERAIAAKIILADAKKAVGGVYGFVKGDQWARNTNGERLNHKPGFDVLERKRRRAKGKLQRNARKANRLRQRYKGL